MGRIAALTMAVLASTLPAERLANDEVASGVELGIISGFRDWPVITVAREEGALDDLRVTLGNETAIKASRKGGVFYPDGSVVVRVAWSYEPLKESAQAFGQPQSHVAGDPKNGVQFMVKDSQKYALTGGWRFLQFNDGKLNAGMDPGKCLSCHQIVAPRDFVFSRYAQ